MRGFRQIIGAMLVVPSLALAAPVSPPPLAPDASNSVLPNARQNLGIGPNRLNIRDYGGEANALRAAAYFSANGTGVHISAVQYANITLTSAGGTTATISPPSMAPSIVGATGSLMFVSIPGAGVAGALVSGFLTASDPTTGNITVASANFASQASQARVMSAYENGGNQVALNGLDYGVHASSTVSDNGKPYGTTIVLADAMLPHFNQIVQPAQAQMDNIVCVVTVGKPAWCGSVVNDNATDGRTFTAAGLRGYPDALPYALSAQASAVYWGPFLFRPDDASACSKTGRSIEIPAAGSLVNPTTNVQNDFVGKISTVINPLTATLTGAVNVNTASGKTNPGYLITGCDDYPAYKRAVARSFRSNRFQRSQPTQVYFPGDSLMASATTNTDNASYTMVLQCGEGSVFWPNINWVLYHGAASCGGGHDIKSFPDVKDVVPASTLKRLTSLSPGATATVVTVGNSPIEPGTNGAGFISARPTKLCRALQRAYPQLVVKCIDRSIGGMQLHMLDPAGWTGGFTAYNLNNSAAIPWWYSDLTKTWMSYIQALNPDVLVIGFSDQEAQAFYLSSLINTIAYTQTAAWATATGKNPDIGLMPFPYQPTTYASQAGTNYAAAMQRAYVKACVDKLANGGCPFIIDVARQQSILTDGYDPEEQPMRRALAGPIYGSGNVTSFPWLYQVPRNGLSAPMYFTYANATPSAGALFAAAGGEIDFTVGASGTSVANTLGYTFKTTTAITSQSTAIVVGYIAYAMKVGDSISSAGGGIPANTIITGIDTSGCTAGVNSCSATINISNAGTWVVGNTITIKPPGPATTYPGNILRVYKDTGGNIASRFDTVFFQTAANCSWTNGASSATCTTPQVGPWHQNLKISFPGAGSAACPDSSNSNCKIFDITTVSYNASLNNTINLSGNAVGTTVSNVVATIYRTSVPYTISGRPAETLATSGGGDLCLLTAGSSVGLFLQVEYRGSSLMLSYCDTVGPGESEIVNQYVERFDGPFQFQIDSPNHMGSGSVVMNNGRGQAGAQFAAFPAVSANYIGTAGQWYEVDPEYPVMAPKLRIAPDVYSYCVSGPFGNYLMAPYGGQCASHQGQMGAHGLDDAIYSALTLH